MLRHYLPLSARICHYLPEYMGVKLCFLPWDSCLFGYTYTYSNPSFWSFFCFFCFFGLCLLSRTKDINIHNGITFLLKIIFIKDIGTLCALLSGFPFRLVSWYDTQRVAFFKCRTNMQETTSTTPVEQPIFSNEMLKNLKEAQECYELGTVSEILEDLKDQYSMYTDEEKEAREGVIRTINFVRDTWRSILVAPVVVEA